MLIRQSKNSFIRCTEHYGYITNQLSRHDRTYDEFGADLLRQLSRMPQEIDDIVSRLLTCYEDVDFNTLKKNFLEFADSLARDNFVVMGETVDELENKDIDFTYSIEHPKTMMNDFYQETEEKVFENTRDFFYGRSPGASSYFEYSIRTL